MERWTAAALGDAAVLLRPAPIRVAEPAAEPNAVRDADPNAEPNAESHAKPNKEPTTEPYAEMNAEPSEADDESSAMPGSGLAAVLAGAAERLRALAGVADVVPAYDSIAVHLELRELTANGRAPDWEAIVSRIVDAASDSGKDRRGAGRTVEIPVLYGGENGPDLGFAAAGSGMSEDDFVRSHSEAAYTVAMIGFAPGFPYLTGLPGKLAQPRRLEPRKRVPAGSVGIAGVQTGVYPVESPGGWQIVGRTPLPLFRPDAEEPFALRAGDQVRFVPATEERWREQQTRLAETTGETTTIRDVTPGLDTAIRDELPSAKAAICEEPAGEPVLTVVKPGLQTTVQDLGRSGWQAFGVSAGGAMDKDALRLANRLVGNDEGAAALELTLLGGEFRVECDCLAAIAGADLAASADGRPLPSGRPVLLRRGARLAFGAARQGCRAYLAVAGGFAVPAALGSRGTDARAGLGGLGGRALTAGDVLRAGEAAAAARRLARALRERAEAEGASWAAPSAYAPYPAERRLPAPGEAATLRTLPGVGAALFATETRRRFAEGEYEVLPASDRMGVRLRGEPLPLARQGELLSHGVAPGAVQVPAGGQPIALAAGCQPTGGYPVLAHVIAADLGMLGQLAPGCRVRFRYVGLEEARTVYARKERELAETAAGIRLKWYP